MVPPPAPVDPHAPGLARTTLRGAAWVGASRFGGRFLFFASTLLLARLLDQEDFGVAAYAITLITLFGSLPGLGLAPALIHHRDDPEMLDTGFWLGLGAGLLAFGLLWAVAPAAGWFFSDARAVDVTRALGLVLPIEALRNVHRILLRKRLAFRRRFVPDIFQSTTKGLVAIGLALAGFGYWSLIWATVGSAALAAPVYWVAAGWRPSLRFDRASARRLLPFGGHVMAVDLLGAFVRNVDHLLVGRFLGAAALGVYTLAFRIPDLLIRNLSVTLGVVLLPVYAKVRSDRDAVRNTFVASLAYMSALTAPMALGLALVAEPLVVTAFSEKWTGVAAVMSPICAYTFLASISYNLGDLYKAIGRPDVLTRLGLLWAAVSLPAVWFAATVIGTAPAVGWAQVAGTTVYVLAKFIVAAAIFGLPVRRALAGTLPVGLACALMAAVVLSLRPVLADHAPAIQLAGCATVGAGVYVASLRLLAREFYETGYRTLSEALSRRSSTARALS